MSEHIHKATDRVRRFLDARDGYFPIDVLAVVTRTGDRLLASDLRALVDALSDRVAGEAEAPPARFEGFLVHLTTDPLCSQHCEPTTPAQRDTFDAARGAVCRVCADAADRAWADGYNHAKVEMLSASIGERAECVTCSGRGEWMDEPCVDCAPFCCYPCARGDHDEHKLAWVPDIPCECPKCASLPGGGL